MAAQLSLVHGPKEPELLINTTLCDLIHEQAGRYGDRAAVIVPWQSVRLSYRDLATRSKAVAKALLETGLQHGDGIGIMDGNSSEYVEVFMGAARIGCPVVVLNNTYTPEELKNAVHRSCCTLVFIAPSIGSRSLAGHIGVLRGHQDRNPELPKLRGVVCLRGDVGGARGVMLESYAQFTVRGSTVHEGDALLAQAERGLAPEDVLNLQFTSGTTGSPKAAMLTNINIINNARFVGNAMRLTPEDVICCGPPLFHCFGLVMGLLASFCHGSSILFPSDHFRASSIVDAVMSEDATVILGVPTMFLAELEVIAKTGQRPRRLRTGLASGSAVSQNLMHQLRELMGCDKMLIAYGMTETSPVNFITSLDDPEERRTATIGRVMPHTAVKVIDQNGRIVPRGQRGELCVSGYALQKGYFRNEKKTREVMRRDENGVLWMHTGDEVMLDDQGYGHITGRIKDIIIRGGENIFPREIEDQLMSHPSISEASVIGIKDERYGEVVGCVLKAAVGCQRISDPEVTQWVSDRLGRHKTPHHVFWLGERGMGDDFPKTGSGKHQKHLLREIVNRLVKERHMGARL